MIPIMTAILLVGMFAHAEVPGKHVQTEASAIEPNKEWNAYATGLIYARPTRGKANTGLWLKSDEIHLVVGNFQDDTKYSGNTWDVSTKSRSVFDK
jgi:hypothetical protein